MNLQFELLNIADYSLMGVTYITCFPMSDVPGRWVRFPEYGAEGLRINVIGPGYIRTPLLEANLDNETQRFLVSALLQKS